MTQPEQRIVETEKLLERTADAGTVEQAYLRQLLKNQLTLLVAVKVQLSWD